MEHERRIELREGATYSAVDTRPLRLSSEAQHGHPDFSTPPQNKPGGAHNQSRQPGDRDTEWIRFRGVPILCTPASAHPGGRCLRENAWMPKNKT